MSREFDPSSHCDFIVTFRGGRTLLLTMPWSRADEVMKWWQSYVDGGISPDVPRFYIWDRPNDLRTCQFDMEHVVLMEAVDPTGRLIQESDEKERAGLMRQQVALQRTAVENMMKGPPPGWGQAPSPGDSDDEDEEDDE